MDYCSDFKYDLKVGQTGEKKLGEILNDSTIEVKTDLKAIHTGNVYIEYESRGKSSGIARSQAKWWCFILSSFHIVMIDSDKLKKKCRKYLNTKRDRKGGDNNTSKGILLPIDELLTIKEGSNE